MRKKKNFFFFNQTLKSLVSFVLRFPNNVGRQREKQKPNNTSLKLVTEASVWLKTWKLLENQSSKKKVMYFEKSYSPEWRGISVFTSLQDKNWVFETGLQPLCFPFPLTYRIFPEVTTNMNRCPTVWGHAPKESKGAQDAFTAQERVSNPRPP